jgi:hypothetical protein
VGDFEKLTAGQEELRLKIKRMTKGRVVKIKMTAATKPSRATTTTAPAATEPAEPTSAPAATAPARPTTQGDENW